MSCTNLGLYSQPWMHSEAFPPEKLAESHLSISSRQGFWRRNLVHCALAAVGGASDHKFSKYDGMEAVAFFTLLFSVLFLGLSPESVITLCVLSHFHQHHQIGTGGKSCYAHILGGSIRRREKMECTMAHNQTGRFGIKFQDTGLE